MKKTYFEEYKCGCVSERSDRKKNLLGYCSTHGADVRFVHPTFLIPVKKVSELEQRNEREDS